MPTKRDESCAPESPDCDTCSARRQCPLYFIMKLEQSLRKKMRSSDLAIVDWIADNPPEGKERWLN